MRVLPFLAFLAMAWAAIKTHMTLPVELGVEQLRENLETDTVTFYAVVRGAENSDYRWILSFVNFTCDGTCAESTSNFCEPTPRLNPGWESHKSAFYPHEGDPPAVHIRRSLEVDGEFVCEDGLEWSYDDSSALAQLSGELYLHTVRGCSETGCPILVSSDVLPFQLSYSTESGELTGLQARDMSYVYDIVSTRNIWLSGYDSLVELTSGVYTLGDGQIVSVPVRFENPSIVSQTMSPEMGIVGLTDCLHNIDESGCYQNWYLQAQTGTEEPSPLAGTMEIVSDLVFSDGSVVQSLLHLNIDVQSGVNPDQSWRMVDSLTSVKGKPYFAGMINPESVVQGDRICMTLSTPDKAALHPGAVRICASQKVDLVSDVSQYSGCRTPNIDDLTVYQIMDISTGFYNASFNPTVEQSQERAHEFRVCFDAVPLSDKVEVIEAYYSRSDIVETSSVKKRQVDDLYVSQGVPVGCSWSESWDPVICRCVPYATTVCCDDDWSWLWIFFIIFVFIFIVGAAALACCYYPTIDNCGYPQYVCEYGRTYVINKKSDGSIYRALIVDGDNNTVTYNSPETENAQNAASSRSYRKSTKTQ